MIACAYGFTGERTYPEQQVFNVLAKLEVPELVVTGACIGVDAAVGKWYATLMPDVRQLVLVPDDLSRVNEWWRQWSYRVTDGPRAQNGFTAIEVRYGCGTYMDRNDLIIANSSELLAFPKTINEELRSGTWSTVRRARKKPIPYAVFEESLHDDH